MKYDLDKVRKACLELMGWKREGKGWSTRPLHTKRTVRVHGQPAVTEWYDDHESKGPHDVLVSPSGWQVFLCGCDGNSREKVIPLDEYEYGSNYDRSDDRRCPNPTRSLDDALPLMQKFWMDLSAPPNDSMWWRAEGCPDSTFSEHIEEMNNSAPLAVCLCALRCAGRDLKEFEA